MMLKKMCILNRAFKTQLSMLLHILVNKHPFVTTGSITRTDYSLSVFVQNPYSKIALRMMTTFESYSHKVDIQHPHVLFL